MTKALHQDMTWPVTFFQTPDASDAQPSTLTAGGDPKVGDAHTWKLTVVTDMAGSTTEMCSYTDFDFSVYYGRDGSGYSNPLPQPATATFNVRLPDNDAATSRGDFLTVGAPITLTVSLDNGVTWLTVATLTVFDRARTYVNGKNTMQVQAVGPLSRMDRVSIGDGRWANDGIVRPYPLETDGVRVLRYLRETNRQWKDGADDNVSTSGQRDPATQQIPDPSLTTGWTGKVLSIPAGGRQSVATNGNIRGHDTVEIEVVWDSDHPLEIVVAYNNQTRGGMYLAGRRADSFFFSAGGGVDSKVTITARPMDANAAVRWFEGKGSWNTWQGLAGPSAATWRMASKDNANVTIEQCQFWTLGWDEGTVRVVPRIPEAADATSLLREVIESTYGTLWETRAGRITYASWKARQPGAPVQLILDACHIKASTEFRVSIEDAINEVRVTYGLDRSYNEDLPADQRGAPTWPPLGTDPHKDSLSQLFYGVLAKNPTTTLWDAADAERVARWIIAAYSTPKETISKIQMLDLKDLPVTVAQKLLTMRAGLKTQVTGTVPADWAKKTPWVGFCEGIKITGSVSGNNRVVAIELSVTDERESLGNMSRVTSPLEVPLDVWRDSPPSHHLLPTGAQGAAGPAGPQGVAGVGISVHPPVADLAARLALVAPPATLAPDTMVLQIDTGEAWLWSNGTWTDTGHLVGPQGVPGLKGDLGPQGLKGDKGDPGVVIAAGSTVVNTNTAFGTLDLTHVFPAGRFTTPPVVTVSNGDFPTHQFHVELVSVTTTGFTAIAFPQTVSVATWIDEVTNYATSTAFVGENTSDSAGHGHIIMANTDPAQEAGLPKHNHHMSIHTDVSMDARSTPHHHASKGHLTHGARPTNPVSSMLNKSVRVNWIAVGAP